MDQRTSCTDLRFAIPCAICNGNGGLGPRAPVIIDGKRSADKFRDCTTCSGTGWTLKRARDLTPAERDRFLRLLSADR